MHPGNMQIQMFLSQILNQQEKKWVTLLEEQWDKNESYSFHPSRTLLGRDVVRIQTKIETVLGRGNTRSSQADYLGI